MIEPFIRIAAFVRKDAIQQLSYRGALIAETTSSIILVAVFYFVSKLVDAGAHPALRSYAGGYFGFVLVGLALSELLFRGLRAFSTQIREGQLTGTLEAMFLAPVWSWEIPLYGSLWTFVQQLGKVAVLLLAGACFGAPLAHANWIGAMLVLFLSVLALAPLGILGAALVLVFQRSDPLSYLTTIAAVLVSGVYYPVEVLPSWLKLFGMLIPLTHSIRAFRAVLLQGAPLSHIEPSLIALGLFATLLGPLALISFHAAVRWAKLRGRLGQY